MNISLIFINMSADSKKQLPKLLYEKLMKPFRINQVCICNPEIYIFFQDISLVYKTNINLSFILSYHLIYSKETLINIISTSSRVIILPPLLTSFVILGKLLNICLSFFHLQNRNNIFLIESVSGLKTVLCVTYIDLFVHINLKC